MCIGLPAGILDDAVSVVVQPLELGTATLAAPREFILSVNAVEEFAVVVEYTMQFPV